jgi:hypothetical protein
MEEINMTKKACITCRWNTPGGHPLDGLCQKDWSKCLGDFEDGCDYLFWEDKDIKPWIPITDREFTNERESLPTQWIPVISVDWSETTGKVMAVFGQINLNDNDIHIIHVEEIDLEENHDCDEHCFECENSECIHPEPDPIDPCGCCPEENGCEVCLFDPSDSDLEIVTPVVTELDRLNRELEMVKYLDLNSNITKRYEDYKDEVKPVAEKIQVDGPKGGPNHYTNVGSMSGIECWDHYELAMSEAEFRGAMKNNVYKYIFRAGHKDSEKMAIDIKKAISYLNRWLKFEEGERTVWMKGSKSES